MAGWLAFLAWLGLSLAEQLQRIQVGNGKKERREGGPWRIDSMEKK